MTTKKTRQANTSTIHLTPRTRDRRQEQQDTTRRMTMNHASLLPTTVATATSNAANHPATTEATNFAKETAHEIRNEFVHERDFSLRLLGLIAGMILIITSILGFIRDFVALHWIEASFHVYIFVLGVIMFLLESEGRLSFLSSYENKVNESVPFVR